MLLRNINAIEGLCNGNILICREFRQNVINAEIATGGEKIFSLRTHLYRLKIVLTHFYLSEQISNSAMLCYEN